MPEIASRALATGVALLFMARASAAQAPASRIAETTATRTITALQVTDAIRIDGVLDEAAWTRATPATGFTQSEPRDGQPASEPTEVMIAFDDQFLYIAARMKDTNPRGEIVNDIRKDFREDDQDDFEVIIDTFRDRRNGYLFIVNPEGGRVDRQIANEGRDINSSWDAVWDVKTRRGPDGWTAEFRIPFRTLRFDPGADQSWGINFSRRIRRNNEITFWAPVPRAYNVMRLSMAGDVTGLHPGQSGRDIRVKPYVLSTTLRELGGTGFANDMNAVGSSRVDLQACKLEYSIVSPK